jgi:para-nitrobenzyl esterase
MEIPEDVLMRVFLLCLMALPLTAAIDNTVRTDTGLIAGTQGSSADVRVFKGIPYAAPPVGELRWREPQPVPPWEGTRAADQFASICMQPPYPEGSPYRRPIEPMSEDCLYLNVWSAARSPRDARPVMVWIHGGGLVRDSGSAPGLDGEEFARKGVVLVTINYRLGILGFLAHAELTKESAHGASGNYGFLDQVAALHWVQKNIAAFGGDPKRVTVFGESGGSWSVNALVASPLAKGLFRAAIGQSGAQFQPLMSLRQAEQASTEALAALRARAAADLVKSSPERRQAAVDGWFLPTEVYSVYKEGKQSDVPLLLGSNADEGTTFVPAQAKPEGLRTLLRFANLAVDLLEFYPAHNDAEARQSAAAVVRDQVFGWQMRTWARMQAKSGKSKSYVYYFSRVPPTPLGEKFGCYHGAELAYVFHHVAGRPEVDQKLSDAMISYWVNFATKGDPNGKGLPKWPVYQESRDMVMELGERIEAIPLPHKQPLDLLDDFYARQRK